MSLETAVRNASLKRLEDDFATLLSSLADFVRAVPPDSIYKVSPLRTTIGETVVRSAATLEQAFGGLTTNLWDDPFEWTLPETLVSVDLIVQYVGEVDLSVQRGFRFLRDDSSLSKIISVPASGQITVLELLERTLVRAEEYRRQAHELLETLPH